MKPEFVDIRDYTYDLPEEKIALYPLASRDHSKLLVYKEKEISHRNFRDLPDLLPYPSTLFFNETKVIPARFFFEKGTGARIEVFLLEPLEPSSLLSQALASAGQTIWKCAIGNLKRWSEDTVLIKEIGGAKISAQLLDRAEGKVRFSWTPKEMSFAQLLQAAGEIPLPPYIKRKAETGDRDRYQTIYSHVDGAVAAPTAGLHFTEEVMTRIKAKGITPGYLTLHVGAGTFMPVKVTNAVEHPMHAEQIVVGRHNLLNLLQKQPVIAVGTTALRTLESLYWYGTLLLRDPEAPFVVNSFVPYQQTTVPKASDAFEAVLKYMDNHRVDELTGSTSIYILPGYRLKVCDGLVTNFHQPGSTLLLLIAAVTGNNWKKIYKEALDHNYRFLSYGDSSLLLRDNSLIV